MKFDYVGLKEHCSKIGSGSTPRGGETVYVKEGVSFIRSQNVYNLDFHTDGLAHITDEVAEKMKSVSVLENDILLNITGDSVARTCLVPQSVLPARVNQHVAIIRPKESDFNSQFLSYYMASPFMQARMLGLAVGKGASRNAITKEMIEGFEVPYPPLPTQRRIADILSAYDDLIENNRKQIKLLEEAAQRLYKEWFVDLRFPGHKKVKVTDGVPDGWERKPISGIANVIMGTSPKSEFYNLCKNGLPFHQGVGSFGDRFVEDTIYSSSITKIADAGSILFSVRAPVGRMNLTRNKVVIGRGLAAINHKNGCQSYLFYMLKEKFFCDNIIGNGSIFASINKDDLLAEKILVANDIVVRLFEKLVQRIDSDILCLFEQIKLLQEARDRLLPRLMSGEIEV